ncbi:hypothetical protein B0T22DRAFT_153827 [Podospora appendiculata]|uniref:Uncharacterized protein n=1 Tax=Podospora appendiculata TaxID=314037 RepID=A0AAE1CCH3_9PEZI|nr:hypothetical protein B0T22DRAFT_153827 [Podospora appendiculata]
MARGSKNAPAAAENDKSLPDRRSRRSGTSSPDEELKAFRWQASEKLRRAQREEMTYKARMKSAAAHAESRQAKAHFREASKHLRYGLQLAVSVVKSVPYLIRDKREDRRLKADDAERQRAISHQHRLDEKLARERRSDNPTRESPREEAIRRELQPADVNLCAVRPAPLPVPQPGSGSPPPTPETQVRWRDGGLWF